VFAKLRSDQILDDVNQIVNPTSGATVSRECADAVAPFTEALTDLDSRLNVGLNFGAYSEKVADARVAYDRLPISELDTACITLVAQPEEDAFNAYVRAYNTWNDCVGDVDCSNDSIESKLQAEWSKATDLLTTVRSRLP
jgi:hypothetical protein